MQSLRIGYAKRFGDDIRNVKYSSSDGLDTEVIDRKMGLDVRFQVVSGMDSGGE
jgi:hypothetical protein